MHNINISTKLLFLTAVLSAVISRRRWFYNIVATSVVIFLTTAVIAQNVVTVKGTVTDNNKTPLHGASVVLRGTTSGVTTDENGAFSINITQSDNAVLRISYVGSITQDVPATGTFLAIELQPDIVSVDEVIVTGYRTISRERITGSFGTLSQTKIESKLQPDIKSILEGQIAGLTIDKDGQVEIRGVSTFSAVKTPLIVIDGYPIQTSLNDNSYFGFRDGTFENINTNNVENITVLKDAVATSIYGTRAANGVIVITTKGGAEGDPKISYRGVFSSIAVPNLNNLHKASPSDYIDAEIDLFNQSPNSANLNSTLTHATYLLAQARDNIITQSQANSEINALRNVDYLAQVQEQLFRPELSHQHNISINGGTQKHSYNLALKYLGTREQYAHSSNYRTTLDLHDKWKFNNYINLRASVGLNYSGTKSPLSTPDDLFSFYGTSSDITPYTAIVDDAGNSANIWGFNQNIQEVYEAIPGAKSSDYVFLDNLNKERVTTQDFQSRINTTLHVDIFKGLSAEVGGQWQRGNYQYQQIYDEDSFTARIAFNNGTSRSNPANHYIPDGAIINEKRNINDSWTIRSQINFNRDFNNGKHRVNAIAGNEVTRETYDNNTLATRLGYNPVAGSFVPVNIQALNAGNYNSDMYLYVSGIASTGSYGYRDIRTSSWYGNGSYEYNNKIIVSGSIRLDLTNFFGTSKEYRYRPHWSVGGTYKLGQESLLNDIDWINRLNLRASHGIGGNIALNQGPFLILGVGSFNNTTGGVSYSVSSPPNNELRWERTQTSNLGIDLALFDNRVNASIDYYYKYTTDCLAPDQLDPTTGFTNITKNVGALSNNGIEITISADAIRSRDFIWNITHNFAYNYNKVLTYNVTRAYPTNYTNGQINHAGYPADGLWGGRFAGLNNLGAVQAYNTAGEVVPIANLTTSDMVYHGSVRPKFDLSLTNRFKYQNWDLSVMFIAKLGHKYRKDAFTGSNIQNRHVKDRWRQAGDENSTIYPVLTSWNMDMFYFPYVDALIGNASYAKLRDVTLSYNFKQLASKLNIADIKVYFQARNLLTVTAKGTDIDPESFELNTTGGTGAYTDQGYSSLPLPKEFYFGIQISL
jgi:TonB-linked SusC/RagA family outer membrane protein